MKSTTLAIVLSCAPALLAAQQGSASASASASANAQANVTVPANYSADAKAKINAAFDAARTKRVPEESMRQRIAEGQAKGASDAQIATAVERTEARLEASQAAMIRAGRANPTPEEISAGEAAMASGASETHIEALVKHAPSDKSLVVAFNQLTTLEQRGVPVANALAQVQANLEGRGAGSANAGGVGAGVGAAVSGAVKGTVGSKRP